MRWPSLSPGSPKATPGAAARSPAPRSQRRRLPALTSAGEKEERKEKKKKTFRRTAISFLPLRAPPRRGRLTPSAPEAQAPHRSRRLQRRPGANAKTRERGGEPAPPRVRFPLGGDCDNSSGDSRRPSRARIPRRTAPHRRGPGARPRTAPPAGCARTPGVPISAPCPGPTSSATQRGASRRDPRGKRRSLPGRPPAFAAPPPSTLSGGPFGGRIFICKTLAFSHAQNGLPIGPGR